MVRQASFEDLGTPLFETTFVVLDIETTGGSPNADTITEIGAIKTKGGERIGTVQTLVRPGEPISGYVELLTGISNGMVALAPPIQEVLPSLWEFLRGAVLVAHNARFDAGFLSSAFRRYGYSIPFTKTVCTLRLARWLMKGETRDMKLETLAGMVGTATRPCHRAFDDAAATCELFHRLLELAGPHGVLTLEDLSAFTRAGRRPAMDKASLAAGVPRTSGVYKFLDVGGKVLYVGKAKNLRARVRSYFYGDERPQIGGLVREAVKVEVERLPTEVASEVTELRLIQSHQPRYNRRGKKGAGHSVWLKLSDGPMPRFVVGRSIGAKDRALLGPFSSVNEGKHVLEALQQAAPIARCAQPKDHPDGCVFGQMGRCCSPCLDQDRTPYRELAQTLADDVTTGAHATISKLTCMMNERSKEQRYEDAALTRDRIEALHRIVDKQRIIETLQRAKDFAICTPSGEVTAIRNGGMVTSFIEEGPFDPARLFDIAPEMAPTIDEMMIVWRYIAKAATDGGWLVYCSGRFETSINPSRASCALPVAIDS